MSGGRGKGAQLQGKVEIYSEDITSNRKSGCEWELEASSI